MFSIGSYQSIRFEDGTINAVIADMGGWPWICTQNLDEPWTQKEFERRYNAYKAQNIKLDKRLAGHFEMENISKGLPGWIPETHFIAESGSVRMIPASTEPKSLLENFADAVAKKMPF